MWIYEEFDYVMLCYTLVNNLVNKRTCILIVSHEYKFDM